MIPESRRPKFAVWLYERGVSPAEAAEALNCTPQYVNRLCKLFDDPRRAQPSLSMIDRVRRFTAGEVQPNDWLEAAVAA